MDNDKDIDIVDMNTPTMFGRPAHYETPEDLQEAISGYFNGGMKKRKIVGRDGKIAIVPIPTITGLCLYLGFADRHSFYDYEKKPEFSHTIKRARTFIENEYEEILITTGNAGAIFALKNFGWHDKQEIEHSTSMAETRDKIKGFLDDTDDGAYDEVSTQSATSDEASSDPEVAITPTDIS